MSGEVAELERAVDGLPDGWLISSLAEVALGKGEYGANVSKAEFEPALPRYVRITDISEQGNLIPTSLASISHEAAKAYLLQEGDLLFARSGATVGKSFLYQVSYGPCAFAGYLIRFRLDQTKIDPYFARCVVQSAYYWDWVTTVQRAQAQPNINAQEYASLPILLPPLDEQQRIAEVLRSVDEAIAAADRASEAARQVFASVRAELLEHARATRNEVVVADAIAKNRGQKITKLQTTDYLDGGAFPIIDQGASLICGFTNDATALWPYDLPVIVFGDHTRTLKFIDFPFVIGADGTQCITPAAGFDARYLYYALQSLDLRGEGYARHFKLLKEKSVPMPTMVEQVEIAEQLSSLEDAIDEAETTTERLLSVKRALVSDLLSGRVRVAA